MPVTFFKQFIYHGLITDVRHSLQVLLALAILLIFIGSIVLGTVGTNLHETRTHNTNSPVVPLYGTDPNSRLFQGALGFTLVISLPTMIDIILSILFLQTWEEFQQPIEFARTFVVSIFFLPNIFIYWQIIPVAIVDLVMFYQYLCLFFVLIYRLHTLSISQPKNMIIDAYPLRDLFGNSIITMILALGYKLASHDILPGKLIWKGFYTAFLLLLQFMTCMKLKPWFQFTWQTSKVVKNHMLLQNKIAFFASMVGVFSCTTISLIHTVTFTLNYVYFPTRIESFIGIEWFFCSALVLWTSVRNFEIRKTELVTANQLQYNRKMTRSISHEIRTPLNTAFMAVDLLISTIMQQSDRSSVTASTSISALRATAMEEMKRESKTMGVAATNELLEIAESIREGCDIALNILNQLLTFEKLSAGMLQLENKIVTITNLLDSNMKLFRMQAQQSGITFKLDRSNVAMDELLVYVDEHKLNQVIRNLLSNAMKFTPRGGVVEVKLQWIHPEEREIIVNRLVCGRSQSGVSEDVQRMFKPNLPHSPSKLKSPSKDSNDGKGNMQSNIPLHHTLHGMRDNGTVLISLIDSGPGVSEEDQKKLFQEYVQINPGELQKGQGTGLGLSISKSIVQLHGGNIGMTSEGKGKGSTFFIELPSYMCNNTDAADEVLTGIYDSLMDPSKLLSPRDGGNKKPLRPSINVSVSHSNSRASLSLSISDPRKPITMLQRMNSFLSGKSRTVSNHRSIVSLSLIKPQTTVDNQMGHVKDIENGLMKAHSDERSVGDVKPGSRKPSVQNVSTSSTISTTQASVPTIDTATNSNGKIELFQTLFTSPSQKYRNKIVPATSEGIVEIESPRNDLIEDLEAPQAQSTVPLSIAVSSPEPNSQRSGGVYQKLQGRYRMSFTSAPPVNKSYRILLVDDSVPNRKILNRLLTREQHIVSEASDGQEAIDMVRNTMQRQSENAQSQEFDLILMDYYMPGMTGPEAIAVIRDMGYVGTILGVSGIMDDDANQFIEAGADLVLYKPITLTALWKALRGTTFFDRG